MDPKEINKYRVEKTVYTDLYGNLIFEEPTIFRRLHAVGETFTENFIRYEVKRVAVFGVTQIVNIVKI